MELNGKEKLAKPGMIEEKRACGRQRFTCYLNSLRQATS